MNKTKITFKQIIVGAFLWIILLLVSPLRLLFAFLSLIFSFYKKSAYPEFLYKLSYTFSSIGGFFGTTMSLNIGKEESKFVVCRIYVNIFTYRVHYNYGTDWKAMDSKFDLQQIQARIANDIVSSGINLEK